MFRTVPDLHGHNVRAVVIAVVAVDGAQIVRWSANAAGNVQEIAHPCLSGTGLTVKLVAGRRINANIRAYTSHAVSDTLAALFWDAANNITGLAAIRQLMTAVVGIDDLLQHERTGHTAMYSIICHSGNIDRAGQDVGLTESSAAEVVIAVDLDVVMQRTEVAFYVLAEAEMLIKVAENRICADLVEGFGEEYVAGAEAISKSLGIPEEKPPTEEEIAEAKKIADPNGTGKVNFEGFKALMTALIEEAKKEAK